jgi:hypothetical protein
MGASSGGEGAARSVGDGDAARRSERAGAQQRWVVVFGALLLVRIGVAVWLGHPIGLREWLALIVPWVPAVACLSIPLVSYPRGSGHSTSAVARRLRLGGAALIVVAIVVGALGFHAGLASRWDLLSIAAAVGACVTADYKDASVPAGVEGLRASTPTTLVVAWLVALIASVVGTYYWILWLES